MSEKYNFSISNDTPFGKVNPSKLKNEIVISSITAAFDYINKLGNDLDIWFKVALASSEQTTLSGIVASHTGTFESSDAPISIDGRPIVRADSRPASTHTMFTSTADDIAIGDGKELFWDFSNNEDEVTAPSGHKIKRIKMSFCDPVYLKEGTIYFFSALKKSHIDFSIICPSGHYYYSRDKLPTLADEDTIVVKYVRKHFFTGDCPMGDELNTEGCAEDPLPTNYELWVDITVPSGDNSSYGWGSLELYRERTYLLPGETQ